MASGMFERLAGELTEKVNGLMDLLSRLEDRHDKLEERVRESERSITRSESESTNCRAHEDSRIRDLTGRVKVLEDGHAAAIRCADKSKATAERLREDFDKFRKEHDGGTKTTRARFWEILTVILAALLGALFSKWLGL